MGLMAFQPGIVKNSAQNDKSACNLQNAWNFAKKKYGKQGGNYRLAQLGGRYKGRGKEFQAPAENTVPQKSGAHAEKQAHNHGPHSVSRKGQSAKSSCQPQGQGAEHIDNVGINRGGL